MRTVYTTILGRSPNVNKDGRRERYILQNPRMRDTSVRWVCFSDVLVGAKQSPWEILDAREYVDTSNPRRASKELKALSHVWFPGTPTMWLDSTIQLRVPADSLFDEIGSCDIGLMRHDIRSCCSQEADAILEHHADTVSVAKILEQESRYRRLGYNDLPLYYGAVVIRQDTAATRRFNVKWLEETERWCLRDMPGIAAAARIAGASIAELGVLPFADGRVLHRRSWCRASQ